MRERFLQASKATLHALALGLLVATSLIITRRAVAAEADAVTGSYATFDVLFMQRDDDASSLPLALDSGLPLITANEPAYAVQPGIRAFYGFVDESFRGWEAGYLGIWNMNAQTEIAGPDVYAPGTLPLIPNAEGFRDRELATASFTSTLNSAEINRVWRLYDGGFTRASRYPWQRCEGYRAGTYDWLLGFRYVGLEESASMTYAGGSQIPVPSTYALQTSSNMFGVQVGQRTRWDWEAWAFETVAKAVLAGNALSQSQDEIVDVITPAQPVRPAQSSQAGSVGFVGDINLSVVRRIDDVWRLRAGYNLIWLSGVALAADQFDFTATGTSGTNLVDGGNVFLHGASLGLEARW